jgi:hypothetical protein
MVCMAATFVMRQTVRLRSGKVIWAAALVVLVLNMVCIGLATWLLHERVSRAPEGMGGLIFVATLFAAIVVCLVTPLIVIGLPWPIFALDLGGAWWALRTPQVDVYGDQVGWTVVAIGFVAAAVLALVLPLCFSRRPFVR